MITRSKLVEQLRDYQIRSQHKCPPLSVFSPKPLLSTWYACSAYIYLFLCSLVDSPIPIFIRGIRLLGFGSDVAVAIFWVLIFVVLLFASYITLYLRHYWLSFAILCLGILIPIRLRISRHSLARKRDRRLLLPLSM
ncbi:hypothetical protein BUALT_Bualt04G0072500 [Buddleja alternifolia]|uniref:Uncharacterized protein n=1 Tax=Buddleja alternifolia TaxID=168488 RepID=A0AAV6XTQ8_9LAMI|nr:hypothetical protein BUALT_Bualt04G0072500 [Buddleja alternifolia]